MSSHRTNNRTNNDQCFVDQQNVDSSAPGNYQMNPMMHRNINQFNNETECMSFSQLRDTMTDHITSRVDIESDLRGQNYKFSECSGDKHSPTGTTMIPENELPPTLFRVVELESVRPSNIGSAIKNFSTCVPHNE